MIEKDTVRMLRECDAGVKMGVASIEDVIGSVGDDRMRSLLVECKKEHEKLGEEIDDLLESYGDDGKEPNPVSKAMSWMKTGVKMSVNNSDKTVAELMVDGCNMGVKYLSKYLNEYKAASEETKNITKRLITLEERLSYDIRQYL